MNNLNAQFNQFMQNIQQNMKQMGVPDNLRNPDEVINFLMRSGKINQSMYNRAAQMAGQLRNQYK